MQLPSNESERRGDTKCDMSPNSIERDFNFRATSVSINDVSDLWTELEAQYFSPPRSKIVNMSFFRKYQFILKLKLMTETQIIRIEINLKTSQVPK